jgi:tRNA (cytidine/uridine-2'-O-)-methyltransferase
MLHLVEPLGFSIEDRQLRRAGLDYHEFAPLKVHPNWQACLGALEGARLFACSTRGATRHTDPAYRRGDAFVFGPETRGLPAALLEEIPESNRLRLPMRPDNRSLNLSNAVAVVVFEAWRQHGFEGGV